MNSEYEAVESKAMVLAAHLGLTSADVPGLDLVSKIVHCAESLFDHSQTVLSADDCRQVVAWLNPKEPPT